MWAKMPLGQIYRRTKVISAFLRLIWALLELGTVATMLCFKWLHCKNNQTKFSLAFRNIYTWHTKLIFHGWLEQFSLLLDLACNLESPIAKCNYVGATIIDQELLFFYLIIFYLPLHMNGRFHSMFFYLNGLLIWIFSLVFNSMFYIGYVTPFAMDIINTTFSLFCPVQNSRPPLPLIQGRQSRFETH